MTTMISTGQIVELLNAATDEGERTTLIERYTDPDAAEYAHDCITVPDEWDSCVWPTRRFVAITGHAIQSAGPVENWFEDDGPYNQLGAAAR